MIKDGECARSKDLYDFVKDNFPNHFVKTNKPYDKGALLVNRKTGVIEDSADSNFKLLEKITASGYAIPAKHKGFNLVEPSIESRTETELVKIENAIRDLLLSAKEWANGKNVDVSCVRINQNKDGLFILLIDGKPAVSSKKGFSNEH